MKEDLFPNSSKMMVMEDDMGINAPRYHQRAIAKLTAGLYPLYLSGTISYEPLPETMLGEETSPTPDLILVDDSTHTTKIIIEVCGIRGEKNDLRKVVWLIEDNEYGIQEGFTYNYMTQCWFRYRKGDGGLTTESSFSDILQIDLNTFLS